MDISNSDANQDCPPIEDRIGKGHGPAARRRLRPVVQDDRKAGSKQAMGDSRAHIADTADHHAPSLTVTGHRFGGREPIAASSLAANAQTPHHGSPAYG